MCSVNMLMTVTALVTVVHKPVGAGASCNVPPLSHLMSTFVPLMMIGDCKRGPAGFCAAHTKHAASHSPAAVGQRLIESEVKAASVRHCEAVTVARHRPVKIVPCFIL